MLPLQRILFRRMCDGIFRMQLSKSLYRRFNIDRVRYSVCRAEVMKQRLYQDNHILIVHRPFPSKILFSRGRMPPPPTMFSRIPGAFHQEEHSRPLKLHAGNFVSSTGVSVE